MKRVYRGRDKWMDIISECRASDLSDAEWCRQNGIKISTFYATVKKMKKAGIKLPPKGKRILEEHIEPAAGRLSEIDAEPRQAMPMPEIDVETRVNTVKSDTLGNTDKPCDIEIEIGEIKVRINNGADTQLLADVMKVLNKS
ncbi:MAG: hypothetical protein J6O71_02805 [Lachnospiraceae bacterium]|nr:hypothetical protein [Lachnospiraceae bacterium]